MDKKCFDLLHLGRKACTPLAFLACKIAPALDSELQDYDEKTNKQTNKLHQQ